MADMAARDKDPSAADRLLSGADSSGAPVEGRMDVHQRAEQELAPLRGGDISVHRFPTALQFWEETQRLSKLAVPIIGMYVCAVSPVLLSAIGTLCPVETTSHFDLSDYSLLPT